MEIKFKAGRGGAGSCNDYRKIIKSGDLKYDFMGESDDAINLLVDNYRDGSKLVDKIIIDCNKKTGVFSLKFTYKTKH